MTVCLLDFTNSTDSRQNTDIGIETHQQLLVEVQSRQSIRPNTLTYIHICYDVRIGWTTTAPPDRPATKTYEYKDF